MTVENFPGTLTFPLKTSFSQGRQEGYTSRSPLFPGSSTSGVGARRDDMRETHTHTHSG